MIADISLVYEWLINRETWLATKTLGQLVAWRLTFLNLKTLVDNNSWKEVLDFSLREILEQSLPPPIKRLFFNPNLCIICHSQTQLGNSSN
jgi:hypothetical protein